MTTKAGHVKPDTCANCGAALDGAYCAECGQSREDIRRPAWSLVTDTLDGLFSWDGRILTTFRQLYTRPGRVARDYVDGKRQSFTPPVRLYIIASLIFFAAIAFSGVRIVAVETTTSADGAPSIFVTIFQRPRDGQAQTLSPEDQAIVIDRAREQGVSDFWNDTALDAMNHPEMLEERASAASSQALILMVFVFALMSLILHPRRKLIEHTIHALYFHAAFLLPLAALVVFAVFIPLPAWAGITVLVTAILTSNAAVTLYDRGFYASSWFGAILRSVLICMGYVTSAVFVAIGLIFVSTL
ncbi:DUF3667 domain-containing protein [Hyphobacterium marinum]|uniref:DUF3667 domain-containing protein n=1 Tax=Hyphobacterium marinum TaxID=3116574 RepID=A0ABU7M087_9PROT|nr:DUF3667 domain-containing protein [Hyphobacterium sp. Y6023]MEE2566957.1 DUF3667 domain-containing protein [Hyphobacterium sp. Y6023]